MLSTRIIPVLLLHNESLVKTIRFRKFSYIGDPCNTVRIFNELEVDELLFLDISAAREKREPNLKVLAEIADECFMPLGYGGGIRTLKQAGTILQIGFEKIVVNTNAFEDSSFISQLSAKFGSQAVVASIDVKKDMWGRLRVFVHSGRENTHLDPVDLAVELEKRGAGEILLTSIDREGTWRGLDVQLAKRVAEAVEIPVIVHGGAGTVAHIDEVVKVAGVSAVALGSMVVFQKKNKGVLVNFPDKNQLKAVVS